MPDIFNANKELVKQPKKTHRKTKLENLRAAEESSPILRADKPAHSALAAYCPKPHSVTFDIQHDDEPILLLLRQHPIVNVGWMLVSVFLLIAPLFLPLFPVVLAFPAPFRVAAVLGWYVLALGYTLERFIIWFYNVYIVTDERIIDVDFYNLVYKRISEAKIENIEDITSESSGILQSVINYGDVRIQTAAEIPQIEFEKVPHPERVSKFLSEMQMQEEQEKLEGRVR